MTSPRRSLVALGGGPLDVLDIPGSPERAPLVLLHEGLGSIGLWRTFPTALQRATGRRLIAFSRYGHGHSGRPRARRTPAFFEEEALDVLPALFDKLDAHEPVLVGHSDGASIALVYAAEHEVSALALLAPHVFVEEMTVSAIRDTRDEYVHGAFRERMARHHDDPDAAFWGWCDVWLDPAFRTWDLQERTQRLTAPTLLIQGADDPYGSLEQLDRIEAAAHGPVRRIVLPGGHSPHLEHEQDVVAAVSAVLADGHGEETLSPASG
jgi:pimeloyl-ACP methyl ester carboxylesterase